LRGLWEEVGEFVEVGDGGFAAEEVVGAREGLLRNSLPWVEVSQK